MDEFATSDHVTTYRSLQFKLFVLLENEQKKCEEFESFLILLTVYAASESIQTFARLKIRQYNPKIYKMTTAMPVHTLAKQQSNIPLRFYL